MTVFYAFIAPVTLHLQLLDPPPPSDQSWIRPCTPPPPLRPVLDTPLPLTLFLLPPPPLRPVLDTPLPLTLFLLPPPLRPVLDTPLQTPPPSDQSWIRPCRPPPPSDQSWIRPCFYKSKVSSLVGLTPVLFVKYLKASVVQKVSKKIGISNICCCSHGELSHSFCTSNEDRMVW